MASWSGKAPTNDVRALFVGLYYRGQRRDDLEREYLTTYHPIDERVPRFRHLPARRLVHITDLYTAEELKTSRTYNEILRRAGMQDGLNVQLPGLGRLPHRLGPERSRRRGGLGVVSDHDGRAAAAPYPAVRPLWLRGSWLPSCAWRPSRRPGARTACRMG